jgi:hypothetical protein
MNIQKGIAICLLSIVPLSISEISQSREQHKIRIFPESNGHGEFCGSSLIENNMKRKGDIFIGRDYKEDSFSMNIDDKTVKLYPVSSKKITKKREVKIYKGDRFRVKIDSTDVSTPKGLKNCGMDIDEIVTVSTDGWKKVILLKVGCDPCG